jgi:hypothetical protein
VPHPCQCGKYTPDSEYDRTQCRRCWLRHHDPRYRAYYATGVATPTPPVSIRLPCVHEGRILSRCAFGDANRDKRLCTLHAAAVTRSGVCRTCGDYREPEPEWRRHLLYYVYPVSGNSIWQCNVDQLLDRIDLFNGRRVVAVARQDGVVHHKPERNGQRPPHTVDPPQMVRDRMAGHGIEFVEIANDGNLGEVAAFDPLWSRVADFTGRGDVTFYGHAKGVTRPVNPGVSVHPWASLLYAANLDYWPVVADQLARHPITGAMKTLGAARHYSGGWHYSGTFFWFRNRDVFARNWRRIDRVYGGIESWPGVQFTADEGGCVYWQEPIQRKVTGYDFPRLRQVLAGFREWSDANAQHRRSGAVNNPWMVRHGYE